ncbi:MAG: cysteine--tRNA ligase [Alphaproteobacteria bacterium]|nr:cysteine--tRNA ligase [Alphaproteobacteria bacterium]
MSLKVFNNLTKRKEVFTPLNPPFVGMYVCGPTVSGESHLGHARPFITFDVIYRYLLFLGYKVRYVRNITDAGHFEEEGRAAEDKISSKAQLEKLEPMELVQKYTNLFHDAMAAFNNLPPSIEPTATGHIVEQIELTKKIIEAGYAYEINGSVYFNVKKYHEDFSKRNQPYGILSGRKIEDQIAESRSLQNQDEKREALDFALWKKAPENHIMRWASPWGEGFPGWHIECSAMSTKYLGKKFDIHGGGMDLQFPHHECEIAQSTVCNDVTPASYWLHNNMITINGKKMGKSYNNVIKLSELFHGNHPLLNKSYSPQTVRFFILQSQYRSTLDFSNDSLLAAEKALKRLTETYIWLQNFESFNYTTLIIPEGLPNYNEQILKAVNNFKSCLDEDFNTAKLLAEVFEILPILNAVKDKNLKIEYLQPEVLILLKKSFKDYLKDILGLDFKYPTDNHYLKNALDLLINLRMSAKKNKDFVTTDTIRQELSKIGIIIKDEKDGGISYSFNTI